MARLRAPQQPRHRRPLPSLDWRAAARRDLGLEPVDCRPCCASGTLVVALLRLAVPISEIAETCGLSVDDLRLTVGARAKPRPEVFGDASIARLGALLGVAAARGLPDAQAIAEAEAWETGCTISDRPAWPLRGE